MSNELLEPEGDVTTFDYRGVKAFVSLPESGLYTTEVGIYYIEDKSLDGLRRQFEQRVDEMLA